MKERMYSTDKGGIHYWISDSLNTDRTTLVFLPGLTADHRLFEPQLAFFEGKRNVWVWDAPGHGVSWPFHMDFTLMDEARWLDEILQREQISKPVMVGQSMGGYVAQAYAQLYGTKLKGFVSIDSAPLQRRYVTSIEIWLLKKMGTLYQYLPWEFLLKMGSNGVAESEYGQRLMQRMMMDYEGQKERYVLLAGHGYKILAEAMEANLPYQIPCPALLLCGTKDRAGSCRRYNKAWHKHTALPLEWVEGAGHNANTDAPEQVNARIEKLLEKISN